MSDYVTIASHYGEHSFKAYVARPSGEPKAAVVVIQEIFGVNPGIRHKCDLLAKQGYLAVAPDLFWMLGDDIELDPDVEAQLQQAFDYFGRFNPDEGIRDIESTIKWARQETGGKKVGAVGYCLGGKLAYMTAARTDADASVGYYAVGVPDMLREAHAIANPLMLHIPTADGFVDAEAQKAMHAGLDDHPKVTLYDYEGLDHGFATQFGNRRDEAGAQLADSRTDAFFAEHLA
ncbi:dienelactone hydrolase family protein [Erythrobacter sp. SDW2]|uniref:dienelactone hydrolase family protein n=1 Tax=Erythrobacter sp. SDW2 TaxID=2907154 RepID=UPI001F31DBEE|nr:dienelactone hydrolase family protein [Erythrobacter sp. SDW2]UIP07314.1 dienelactone hydrolase family protein [Erythrobacter sp. SDW2]